VIKFSSKDDELEIEFGDSESLLSLDEKMTLLSIIDNLLLLDELVLEDESVSDNALPLSLGLIKCSIFNFNSV